MSYTVEEFKLAVIRVDEFTDEQIERMFIDTKVENEDDISLAVNILGKHHPILCQKMTSEHSLFGGLVNQ